MKIINNMGICFQKYALGMSQKGILLLEKGKKYRRIEVFKGITKVHCVPKLADSPPLEIILDT